MRADRPMHTLYALDLTETPDHDFPWRRRRTGVAGRKRALTASASRPDLSSDGFASPLGFWFAEAESWIEATPSLRVEFCELDKLVRGIPEHDFESRGGDAPSRVVRAR